MNGDVKAFGAVGDGVADDTDAIQRAIDAGGAAVFPFGTYRVGTLYLRSNGGLDLSSGARLVATEDPARWCARDFCEQQRNAALPDGWSGAHLIVAVGQRNVFIRGGEIDGNGRRFFKADRHVAVSNRLHLNPGPFRPSQMLYFVSCDGVRLESVSLRNSAMWNCFLHGCDNVVVCGLDIRSDDDIGEDDGLDIDCCRNVVVSDCLIDTGDDGITLRANGTGLPSPAICENVAVSNCVVRSAYAHALRIGVGNGEIRNCQFSNIVFGKTRGGIWICSKYSSGRGVDIRDISFRGIQGEANCLLFVRHDYKFVAPGEEFGGVIERLRFSGVSGRTSLPLTVLGNGRAALRDVLFDDCDFTIDRSALPDEPGERRFFQLGDETGAWLTGNVESIDISRARIQ